MTRFLATFFAIFFVFYAVVATPLSVLTYNSQPATLSGGPPYHIDSVIFAISSDITLKLPVFKSASKLFGIFPTRPSRFEDDMCIMIVTERDGEKYTGLVLASYPSEDAELPGWSWAKMPLLFKYISLYAPRMVPEYRLPHLLKYQGSVSADKLDKRLPNGKIMADQREIINAFNEVTRAKSANQCKPNDCRSL